MPSSGDRLLIEPHYLPSLEFFIALSSFSEIILDVHSHYVKQSYRNRALINTANGVQPLIIPVTNRTNRTPLKDIRILEDSRWKLNHWRTIESAYRNAPFFEFYSDDLKNYLFSNQFENLYHFTSGLLSICLKWLGWDKRILFTEAFVENHSGMDMRNQIKSKVGWQERLIYTSVAYRQVFGSAFAANLSLIDLIFCTGPEAAQILIQSARKPII